MAVSDGVSSFYYPNPTYGGFTGDTSSKGQPATLASENSSSADQTLTRTTRKNSIDQLIEQKTRPLVVQLESITGENTKLKTKVDELERKNIDLELKVNRLAALLKPLQSHPTTPQFQRETPPYMPSPVLDQREPEITDYEQFSMHISPIRNTPRNTPPPTSSRSDMAASHKKVETAVHFLREDDFGCALKYIDEAIAFNPYNAGAFAYKSEICRMLNDFPASLEAAEDAIAMDPDNIMALVNKALALRFFSRIQEALDISEIVLSKEPNNIFALRTKLETLFMLGNHKESLKTIDYTLKYHPDDPTAARILGLINQAISNRSPPGGTADQFTSTGTSSMGDM